MNSQEKGRPLPKFGEWDVNNPASADGFTVIFAKARDDKKANSSAAPTQTPRNDYAYGQPNPYQQETRDVSVAVNYESLRPSGTYCSSSLPSGRMSAAASVCILLYWLLLHI